MSGDDSGLVRVEDNGVNDLGKSDEILIRDTRREQSLENVSEALAYRRQQW